jgi:hypothetical protein
MYTVASVAHWQSIHVLSGWARVQSQAKTLYLNLGSLYHIMKKQAVKIERGI